MLKFSLLLLLLFQSLTSYESVDAVYQKNSEQQKWDMVLFTSMNNSAYQTWILATYCVIKVVLCYVIC